jgi:hypothetical protein
MPPALHRKPTTAHSRFAASRAASREPISTCGEPPSGVVVPIVIMIMIVTGMIMAQMLIDLFVLNQGA